MTVTLTVKEVNPKNPKQTGLSACSGVFIEYDRVLTASHCINTMKQGWIKAHDGKSYSVRVVYRDALRDLAILKVIGIKPHTNVVKFWGRTAKGEPVLLVSNASGMNATYSMGIVANFIHENGQSTIVHTGQMLPGSSGSGLFNQYGKLIGLNNSIYKGFSYAASVEDIRDFLNEAYH